MSLGSALTALPGPNASTGGDERMVVVRSSDLVKYHWCPYSVLYKYEKTPELATGERVHEALGRDVEKTIFVRKHRLGYALALLVIILIMLGLLWWMWKFVV